MDAHFSQRQADRRNAAATIATALSVMASTHPEYELELRRAASRLLLSDYMSQSTRVPATMLKAVIGQPIGEQLIDGTLRAETAHIFMQLSHRIPGAHLRLFIEMCEAFQVLWRRGGSSLLPLIDQAASAARSRLGGADE